MAIKYEAYTRQGQKVKGILQTDSEEDAYGMLEEDELVPYRLRLVTPRRSLVQLMPGLFKPKPQEIIDFTRQLSTLLDSGIPLRRALAVQRDQTASAGLKEAVDRIIQDIEAGERFSGAFSRHGTVFPDFFLRMVRVGEATGGIPLILSQLTENLQRRKVVKDRVRRALVYPAISLAVAMVAAFVLVTYALPNLTSLLQEFGGELPLPTQILITISGFLETYAASLFLPLIGLMVGVGVLTRTASGRRIQDRVLLQLPVAGKILQGSNMFFMTNDAVDAAQRGRAAHRSDEPFRGGARELSFQVEAGPGDPSGFRGHEVGGGLRRASGFP